MKNIRKGTEPTQLAQYRHAHPENYEDYPGKDDLRRSLVREQRGLCCYCLSPIDADRQSMRIEHWHPQHSHPAERLAYSNLLAACNGGERGVELHCDVTKGGGKLSRNPANPNHAVEDLIRYENGMIVATDAEFDRELNATLNLNCKFLQQSRKQTLRAFQDSLGKRPLTRKQLQKLLAIWNGDLDTQNLRPFCMVVVYYIRKRLARPPL